MSLALMKLHQDRWFERLLDHCLSTKDPYQAAALHPWVNGSVRECCENQIFSNRRYPRLFARAGYTPASLLERLAMEGDRIIQNKLLKNTATPIRALWYIARRCNEVDRLVLVAVHPQSSCELLAFLGRKNQPALRHALSCNPNTGLIQLQQLLTRATLSDRKGMAKNSHCDKEMLSKLWDHRLPFLCAEIVSHANCPGNLLNDAIASDLPLLRRKAATNPLLSQTQRTQLLTDKVVSVRAAALCNSINYNASLTHDSSLRMRRLQAWHNQIDPRLLKQLSVDEDHWVRRRIARNSSTPHTVLTTLASDSNIEVRRGVSRNPAISMSLRRQLAVDPADWVRAGIAYRDDLDDHIINQLSRDNSIDVLSGLARNPGTPENLLFRFANHQDRDLRRAVILNTNTPLTVLKVLQQDPYPINRAQLCRHFALTNAILWQFLNDPDPQVRFTTVQVLAARCAADQ